MCGQYLVSPYVQKQGGHAAPGERGGAGGGPVKEELHSPQAQQTEHHGRNSVEKQRAPPEGVHCAHRDERHGKFESTLHNQNADLLLREAGVLTIDALPNDMNMVVQVNGPSTTC